MKPFSMMLAAAMTLAAAAAHAQQGSGAPISPGNLKAFCRGEVAGAYGTRPVYVKTRAPKKVKGGWTIDGTVNKGNEGIKAFKCRFDAKRRFIDVMAMTSDGE